MGDVSATTQLKVEICVLLVYAYDNWVCLGGSDQEAVGCVKVAECCVFKMWDITEDQHNRWT